MAHLLHLLDYRKIYGRNISEYTLGKSKNEDSSYYYIVSLVLLKLYGFLFNFTKYIMSFIINFCVHCHASTD